ncbi:spermatogenesis associated 2-like isoform X2 [Gouania willdenowi]|uniref:spermatogenesis associated 2-like isoform X2 n=1 Tax=Gouania willdenowi TaxID=441366 RepID=UPI00105668A2|nr:spermatogenesis-associated protein 2-like protein isoform X2 [Gouania willdenowi]
MSSAWQRARDLLSSYKSSLERQISGRGLGVGSRDEELREQVEMLLRDADARETHCLGLDPLVVMEESLKASSVAACGRRGRPRGGLQALAKAFEVLEQAALNLYLSPWREEYRVIKMYSGTFTHCITPALPASQIENLFGLLGYKTSSPLPEKLTLHSAAVRGFSADDFLRLSCAFFLARCECCLLLATLGKHGGDAQWELSLVKERQQGHNLEVAFEITKKCLEVNQPLMEAFEVDLYREEHVNGSEHQASISDGPLSLAWINPREASPPAAKTHSHSVTASPLDMDESRTDDRKQSQLPCGESRYEDMELLRKSRGGGEHLCSCLRSTPCCLRHCEDCDAVHSITCPTLDVCRMNNHLVELTQDLSEAAEASGFLLSDQMNSSVAYMASLDLHDEPKSMIPPLRPITFHDCCDLTSLDPRLLCHSCSVFHTASCREGEVCLDNHRVKQLGRCSCGKACLRKPLVLCRCPDDVQQLRVRMMMWSLQLSLIYSL